jgi:TatA/E family protein of Tat protein translocase
MLPFNIGPGELILFLIIALVVLGPGKLPDVAQSLGRSVREFRKAATDISDAGKLDVPPPSQQATAPAPPLEATPAAAVTPPPPATAPAQATEPAPVATSTDTTDPDEEVVPAATAAGAPAGSPARDPNVS